MATNFPTSVDVLTNPVSNDSLNSPSHSAQHANANDAIEAIESYLINKTNGSAVYTANATLGTSYATYITINLTSLARPMLITWSAVFSNQNSGASRSTSFKVAMDGTTVGTEFLNIHSPYVAGIGTPTTTGGSFIVTPASGARVFTLQALASSGAAVALPYATMTIVEL